MATFRQRGNKVQARVQRKGFEPQTASFDTLTNAKAWARRIEASLDQGIALGQSQTDKISLADLLADYRKVVTPKHKGRVEEGRRLAAWQAWPLAKRAARDVKPSDVAQWRDKRLQAVGPATVVREVAILSAAYEWARLDLGLSALSNPTKSIRKPAVPEGRSRRVADDEVQRILAATSSHALQMLLPLAISTTSRRGELLKVTWRDIDTQARTMHLRDTKNGLDRLVALSPAALAILEAMPRTEGRLFEQTPQSLTTAFIRAVKRARAAYVAECHSNGQAPDPDFLVGVRLHDARREGASKLFESGLSIPEVASMTGHRSWKCLQTYTALKVPALALKLQSLAA